MAQWPPAQTNYSPQQQQQPPQQQQQPAYLDPRFRPSPSSPKQTSGGLTKALNVFSTRPSFPQIVTPTTQFVAGPQSYNQPQPQWQQHQQQQQPQFGPPVQQQQQQFQPQQQYQQQPHFQQQQQQKPPPQPQQSAPPPAYQPPAQPTPPYTPPDPELARLRTVTTEQETTINQKTTEIYDAKIENSRLTRLLADKDSECARVSRELETITQQLVRKSTAVREKDAALEKGKREAVELQGEIEVIKTKAASADEELLRVKREGAALQGEVEGMKKKAALADEELLRTKREAATLRAEVETIHKRALEKDDIAARAQREAELNSTSAAAKTAEIEKLRKEILDLQATVLKNSNVARELEAAKAEVRTLRQEIQDKVTDEEAHRKTWHDLQVMRTTLATKDNEIARLNHVIKSKSVLPETTNPPAPRPVSPIGPAYVKLGYVPPQRRDSGASTMSSVSAMSNSSQLPYPGFVAPRRESGATNSAASNRRDSRVPLQKTNTLPYPER